MCISFSELSWALYSRLNRWCDKNTTVGSKGSFFHRGTIDISYLFVNCGKRTSNCSKWHLPDTVSMLGWAGWKTLPGLSYRGHMAPCEPCRSVNSLVWPGFPSHCCLSEHAVLCTETSVLSAWREQQCRWSCAACTKPQEPTTNLSSKCGSRIPPCPGRPGWLGLDPGEGGKCTETGAEINSGMYRNKAYSPV